MWDELDYDPYEEGLLTGDWTQRNGAVINITEMSNRHLRNAIRIAKLASQNATFSCESEKFDEWVGMFEDELFLRERDGTVIRDKTVPNILMTVHCQ